MTPHDEHPLALVPEDLGSAVQVNLDGKSEFAGYRTAGVPGNQDEGHAISGPGAPWDRIPSLKSMAEEAGVDFDLLIEAFRKEQTTTAIASQFGVSEQVICDLEDHFIHYGIQSVEGFD